MPKSTSLEYEPSSELLLITYSYGRYRRLAAHQKLLLETKILHRFQVFRGRIREKETEREEEKERPGCERTGRRKQCFLHLLATHQYGITNKGSNSGYFSCVP